MSSKAKPNHFFRKKVYASIYNPSSMEKERKEAPKKIVPSSKIHGIREDFKKVFLPLLIDVFELRQQVHNFKLGAKSPFFLKKDVAKPEEILKKLTDLQSDIEESRRWCEGVIHQIAKGIDDAKEALQFIDKMSDKVENKEKCTSLKSRLRRFFLKNDKCS